MGSALQRTRQRQRRRKCSDWRAGGCCLAAIGGYCPSAGPADSAPQSGQVSASGGVRTQILKQSHVNTLKTFAESSHRSMNFTWQGSLYRPLKKEEKYALCIFSGHKDSCQIQHTKNRHTYFSMRWGIQLCGRWNINNSPIRLRGSQTHMPAPTRGRRQSGLYNWDTHSGRSRKRERFRVCSAKQKLI